MKDTIEHILKQLSTKSNLQEITVVQLSRDAFRCKGKFVYPSEYDYENGWVEFCVTNNEFFTPYNINIGGVKIVPVRKRYAGYFEEFIPKWLAV